jgi:hypothetical protein
LWRRLMPKANTSPVRALPHHQWMPKRNTSNGARPWHLLNLAERRNARRDSVDLGRLQQQRLLRTSGCPIWSRVSFAVPAVREVRSPAGLSLEQDSPNVLIYRRVVSSLGQDPVGHTTL